MKTNRHGAATRHAKQAPPSEIAAEFEETLVIERAEGFYVQWKAGGRESGPFPSLIEAIDSERSPEEADGDAQDALAEAEADLGVADWIDPETHEPAEERRPRIEDQ